MKEIGEFDYILPVGDLPALFLASLNWPGPLPPSLSAYNIWRNQLKARLDQLGGGLKIGISWRGGLNITRKPVRSISPELWCPLLSVPDVHFISLQYGDVKHELEAFVQQGLIFHHWQEAIDDYDETAALVSELDLIISVQTSIVHLGGALGKVVWALISAGPEWRYGIDCDKMPWYKHVSLFRQKEMLQWQPVIDEVVAALIEHQLHLSLINI